MEIGSPITSLTPLQSSFRNPSFEVIFIDNFTLIAPEEMPPLDFLFSKKRRVIIKRETHQKDGVIVKRKIMLYDGQNRDDTEFAKEVVGWLGAFATANQWSVENLSQQLQQKSMLVEKLQNKIHTNERTIQNRMSRYFEQIKAYDKKQIQRLQANFDELQRNSQFNKGLITQHVEIIKQLQDKLVLTEGTSLDILALQTQAMEINEKLENAHQDLFMKVEAIQNYYQTIDISLKDIYNKEREAHSSRVKFQEAVLLVPKDDVSEVPRLSLSEQIRGDITLKSWETNLAERKRLAWEVNEACIEALSFLDKRLIYLEGNAISEALGQIYIAKNQYNSRTSKEEALEAI
jgi:hypothetical protein